MCRCCANLKALEEVYQEKMLPPPPLQPRPIVYNYPTPTTASRGNNFAEIIQEVIAEQEDESFYQTQQKQQQQGSEQDVLEYGYVEENDDEEYAIANQI